MVLISLISLRRLLRQRGFVSFRLLFLATTQRVSRCSLPSLRGRGTSMSFITYVIMTSVHYVILASASLLLCLLHTQPLMSLCHYVFRSSVTMSFTYSVPYVFMSFWLLFLCYYVFYILRPLCLYVILSSVPLLLCLLHTLSPMSLCHSGFISIKYFYELPILSVNSEWQVGQYLPFLSRTFREKFISIKNTIVYKIKKRRQNSDNHKFIYLRRTGKEVKERKNRCKKKGFVYIFHNKG